MSFDDDGAGDGDMTMVPGGPIKDDEEGMEDNDPLEEPKEDEWS